MMLHQALKHLQRPGSHLGSVCQLAVRCLSTTQPSYTKNEVRNVTVVGSGLMGSGIVQVAAQNQFNVTVVDSEDESLQRCMLIIRKSLGRLTKKRFPDQKKAAEKFIDDVFKNITLSQDLNSTLLADCDLLIEAIPEILPAKQALLASADENAPPKTIFATNTSSLSVTEIGNFTNRRSKFAGLHFFNPVPVMKLAEVIRTEDTSQQTMDSLLGFVKDIGKTPVICHDTPGFIVNRLLVPYMMEAVRMLERGHASKEDIDTAMKLGATYPMGPFELLDYVGLDTTKFIIDGWHTNDPDNSIFSPSPTLNKLVAEGKLGRKTGEGFYKY